MAAAAGGAGRCFFAAGALLARLGPPGRREARMTMMMMMPRGGARAASGGLPKELLPGPYPRTAEERAAAARKYNLRLEDYQPHPDDGMGYGDYPKLPDRSQQERDPYYSWDHSNLRRNYGEPLHWDFDMFLRTRVDTTPTVLPWHTMRNYFLGFVGFMFFMFGLGAMYPSYQPVGPKQYPYSNLYLETSGDPNQEVPEVKHYEI